MSVISPSHYRWHGGEVSPSLPWIDPGPGYEPPVVPAQPGAQGERLRVAIVDYPSGRFRGVLWDAKIDGPTIRARRLGPNTVTVTAPATPTTMRILGDPIPSAPGLYKLDNMVARGLLVGSNRAGGVLWRFVIRDRVQVRNGRVELQGVGIVGGLSQDRVIGAPTRLNLLGQARGSFASGTLTGWRHVGPGSSGIEPDDIDGDGFSAWVIGTPGLSWLEAKVRWKHGAEPWGRQWFAASAYVKLPTGEDIDGYGLVSLGVVDSDGKVWWDHRLPDGDPEIGRVSNEMATGRWVSEAPVTAKGLLPRPPYVVDLLVRFHATHVTKKTYYDGGRLFRPEVTATDGVLDLTRHVGELWQHANVGRGKSNTGVTVSYGASAGISEQGIWYHADGQSLDEAVEALCGRGLDVWDLPGPGWQIRAAKRRGSVRNDIVVNPWDVLGEVQWEVDPGAQRTAGRAQSQASTLWGGADEGYINTTQSRGQVIDVNMAAPAGMLPGQLRDWIKGEINDLALLPHTATLVHRLSFARRLNVGDGVMVRQRSGAAAAVGWMRITQMAFNFDAGVAVVDYGTDPDLGGPR